MASIVSTSQVKISKKEDAITNIDSSNDEKVSSSEMETDSSEESDDSDISESESSGEDVKNKKQNTAFKFHCLEKFNSDDKSTHENFSSWLHVDKSKSSVLSNIDVKKMSAKTFDEDFTPWWDQAKSKQKVQNLNSNKDERVFKNWFKENSSNSKHWLSGPSNTSEKVVPEIEDIEVPSIFNSAPKRKGRRAMKRERKAERDKTTGKKWFDMKAPDVDNKMKMDMEILKMRSVLDPKRFYKHNDRKGLPKYFQMGTVVDEGTDFYSSRLSKKQRKQTLVEELMADADIRQYNKKKYQELQQNQRMKKFKSKKK